jgi:predicted dehydrogenase
MRSRSCGHLVDLQLLAEPLIAMTDNKIRIGIVGLSAKRGWAAETHIPALARLPQFEIRGLAASSKESAKAAAEKFGVAFFTDDPAALAARPDIDLVVVAVKVIHHRALVETALSAGKHVLCEWPLGTDLVQAEAMAELARAKGVRGFVGLQARFQPAVTYVRDLVREGYVGDVVSTSVMARVGGVGRGGPVPREKRYYLDRRNGSGMLNIPIGHALDGLCTLFGELTQVRATLALKRPWATIAETGETVPVTAPDAAAISGVFESGAVAAIHYRTASPGTGFHWEIDGGSGALLVTSPTGHLQLGPLKVFGANVEQRGFAELQIPDRYTFEGLATSDRTSPVGLLYRALADDLRTGTTTVASFDHAVRRHRMINDIEQAIPG